MIKKNLLIPASQTFINCIQMWDYFSPITPISILQQPRHFNTSFNKSSTSSLPKQKTKPKNNGDLHREARPLISGHSTGYLSGLSPWFTAGCRTHASRRTRMCWATAETAPTRWMLVYPWHRTSSFVRGWYGGGRVLLKVLCLGFISVVWFTFLEFGSFPVVFW